MVTKEVFPVDLRDPNEIQNSYLTPGTSTLMKPKDFIHGMVLLNQIMNWVRMLKVPEPTSELMKIRSTHGLKPRWKGHAMEVGPLARYIIGYAQGHEAVPNKSILY